MLSPLGLFMHSAPALSASNRIANLQQGATVTVLDFQPANGGWFKVMGQTTTGWIVADPTLTAQGTFASYPSTAFSALYPDTWTFRADAANTARFVPQQGSQSIVVVTAASISAFGGGRTTGYTSTSTEQIVPCGYTGSLVVYMKTGSGSAASASPSSGAAPAPTLALYAEIQLRFDAMHAMLIAYNYDSANQLDIFRNFYNSISFPYPQCEQTATTSPSPT